MPPILCTIYRKRINWLILWLLLLVGCTPTPSRTVYFAEPLLQDTFDTTSPNWDQHLLNEAFVGYENGGYHLQTTLQQYVFGLHQLSATDVIVEAEAYVLSAEPRMIYGVLCRASSAGRGYYFLVSANGNFSIRRINTYQDEPLVSWQSTSAVYTGKRRNVLRAVCLQDYLAFYINGEFVAEVHDNLLHEGNIGVVTAVAPSATSGATADVVYDAVRVWAGR